MRSKPQSALAAGIFRDRLNRWLQGTDIQIAVSAPVASRVVGHATRKESSAASNHHQSIVIDTTNIDRVADGKSTESWRMIGGAQPAPFTLGQSDVVTSVHKRG